MVYDRHTARVRVIVTDENGELKAETAYYNGEGVDTDAAHLSICIQRLQLTEQARN